LSQGVEVHIVAGGNDVMNYSLLCGPVGSSFQGTAQGQFLTPRGETTRTRSKRLRGPQANDSQCRVAKPIAKARQTASDTVDIERRQFLHNSFIGRRGTDEHQVGVHGRDPGRKLRNVNE